METSKKEMSDFFVLLLSPHTAAFVFVEGSIFGEIFLRRIRVIRLGAGGYSSRTGRARNCEVRIPSKLELADFFAPKQSEVGAKRVITVCPGLCEMSVGKGVTTNRPTDRRRFF